MAPEHSTRSLRGMLAALSETVRSLQDYYLTSF